MLLVAYFNKSLWNKPCRNESVGIGHSMFASDLIPLNSRSFTDCSQRKEWRHFSGWVQSTKSNSLNFLQWECEMRTETHRVIPASITWFFTFLFSKVTSINPSFEERHMHMHTENPRTYWVLLFRGALQFPIQQLARNQFCVCPWNGTSPTEVYFHNPSFWLVAASFSLYEYF